MTPSCKVDYLIIGQGLAGSVMAMALRNRGKSVMVLDGNQGITSSKVAAGMINPVTGRRFVKTWQADTLIPKAKQFYQQLEAQLDERFFYQMPVYRLFGSVREQNDALARAGDESMSPWLEEGELPPHYSPFVHQQFGGIYINRGGWLHMPQFASVVRHYLARQDSLRVDPLQLDDLQTKNGVVQYHDIEATHAIFCEGASALANPYWQWLPFVPAKGELLTLYHSNFPDDAILNRHSFLLPLGNGYFRFGATYEWDDLTPKPTSQGYRKLQELMAKYLTTNFETVDHTAAVRPTVKDRRPIIGSHPDAENLWIFNGLGTKGVILAPYFADQLIRLIEEGQQLDGEVSISRFANHFASFSK